MEVAPAQTKVNRVISPRLRVLEVLEATIGGTKRHVLDILAGLSRSEVVEVEVACPLVREEHHGDTSFVDDARALGVRVHLVPMVREINPRRDITALLALARIIRLGRFDVVHTHSSKAGALGRAAARLSGALGNRPRTIYTPNGFAFLSPGSPRRARAYTTLERFFGHRATDCLIAVSEDERQEAIRRNIAPAERIRVIHNGVDPVTLPTEARADEKRRELGWGERGETIVVGAVGRLTLQKDPATWIAAAALVLSQRPDLRFVWIGGGELEAEIRTLARERGITDEQFQLFGYRTDARELIRAFDIFALSSLYEGLPYVLVEALAMERPVVATSCSGNRDLIQDGVTGHLVPPENPAGLAERILHLVDHPEDRARLARGGRQRFEALCTLDRQVGGVLDVYQSLAKN